MWLYLNMKLNVTYYVDRFLSGFVYGHASVRLHYVSWLEVWFFMTCLPLYVQDSQTPLFIASRKGHDQIVELLLRRKADVNHQTKVRLFMSSMCILLYCTGLCNVY